MCFTASALVSPHSDFCNQSIPSIMQFVQQVTNEDNAIYWLVSMGIIKPIEEKVSIEVDCCGRMSIKSEKASFRQLKWNSCCSGRSCFANIFFDGAKVEINKILYMVFMWLNKCSLGQAFSLNKKTSNKLLPTTTVIFVNSRQT